MFWSIILDTRNPPVPLAVVGASGCAFFNIGAFDATCIMKPYCGEVQWMVVFEDRIKDVESAKPESTSRSIFPPAIAVLMADAESVVPLAELPGRTTTPGVTPEMVEAYITFAEPPAFELHIPAVQVIVMPSPFIAPNAELLAWGKSAGAIARGDITPLLPLGAAKKLF